MITSHHWPYVGRIHRSLVVCPHKGPVMCKVFPCDDVVVLCRSSGAANAGKHVYSTYSRPTFMSTHWLMGIVLGGLLQTSPIHNWYENWIRTVLNCGFTSRRQWVQLYLLIMMFVNAVVWYWKLLSLRLCLYNTFNLRRLGNIYGHQWTGSFLVQIMGFCLI